MPSFTDHRPSPYTTRQIYAIVADIPAYPEFLPWVGGARVKQIDAQTQEGELLVRFKNFSYKYVSTITLHPPEGEEDECAIEVEMKEGPFRHLTTHWRFVPCVPKSSGKYAGGEEQRTMIHFAIDFRFKSAMMEKLVGGMFGRAVEKMAKAFQERADALHGHKK